MLALTLMLHILGNTYNVKSGLAHSLTLLLFNNLFHNYIIIMAPVLEYRYW